MQKDEKKAEVIGEDRKRFAEILQEITEAARQNGNQLSQAEIQRFFRELSLSEEQMNHIYSYLAAQQITMKDFTMGKEQKRKPDKTKRKKLESEPSEPEPDSTFLQMYLREVRALERLNKKEEWELADQLVSLASCLTEQNKQQFADLKEKFIKQKLHEVVNRARGYSLGGEWLDELVQEGNIGLLLAVDLLVREREFQETERFLKLVEEQIEEAMELYIQESYAADSGQKSIVAKVNFVSEAAKALKEENGQEPTLKELAAYTNISQEELLSIINLSADNLKA